LVVVKIKALREVPVENLHNFITSMFYIVNRFLVVGLWRLRGREAVRARERHPFTLQRYSRGEYLGSRDTRTHGPWRGSFYDSAVGSVLELHLRRRPGRRDGWGLRRKALSSEVSLNRRGVGDEGDDFHLSLTGGTHGDIDLKHTTEQSSPSQSIFGRAGFLPFFRRLIPVGFCRYDLRSLLGGRCEDSVIPSGVRSRRRHYRGQFF
jgi:hypothetical protein